MVIVMLMVLFFFFLISCVGFCAKWTWPLKLLCPFIFSVKKKKSKKQKPLSTSVIKDADEKPETLYELFSHIFTCSLQILRPLRLQEQRAYKAQESCPGSQFPHLFHPPLLFGSERACRSCSPRTQVSPTLSAALALSPSHWS